MTKRCYVCGDFIIEGEICTTCLNVLKLKYPNKKELESILQRAIVIDQDNHAEFINKHYIKLRPEEGPNTLKYAVTNAIIKYATEQSNFHIILSNCNLYKQERANILRYFYEKGFSSIIVYFELPMEILTERIERAQKSKAIFRSATSFMEV